MNDYSAYSILRRNGAVVSFEPSKISVALMKAFLAINGRKGDASASVRETVDALTEQVVRALLRSRPSGGTFHIEDIQDQVELGLMRGGHHEVARAYVLYRELRAQERAKAGAAEKRADSELMVTVDGQLVPLDMAHLTTIVEAACADLGPDVVAEPILLETRRNLYSGVPIEQVYQAAILAGRTLLEKEPGYTQATARLLLHTIRKEVLGEDVLQSDMAQRYAEHFSSFVKRGVDAELLDERLLQFDLPRLGVALKAERDLQFDYLGLQTLYDRYFLHVDKTRIELPQSFFMRVAMGLALNEIDREARAIEFYEVLSSFDFMSSTPTLFNSGTRRAQLSSCYLTTVSDDLEGIYDAIKENALLSKFAGGLGNDWSRVRALGSHIKGTNGESQGVVPFLKVVNDTAVAVNQCFAPETQIYTADGLKTISDVAIGDLVLGSSGKYREVEKTMVYDQSQPMVAIKAKHAPVVRVTDAHPIYAIKGVSLGQSIARTVDALRAGKIKAEWVDAGKIKVGDYVAQIIPTEIVNIDGFSKDDARFYGIMLGDGHCTASKSEFGVSLGLAKHKTAAFVRKYLTDRAIRFWEFDTHDSCVQIRWSYGKGLVREAATGRYVSQSGCSLPFAHADMYDNAGKKRIAKRFSHLPLNQSIEILRGLIETDGGIYRNNEVHFYTSSEPLLASVRYQLLRHGVPTSFSESEHSEHNGTRADGPVVRFPESHGFDLRIPAFGAVAQSLNVSSIQKQNWIDWDGAIFTRVTDVTQIDPCEIVHDLLVDVDESYMTNAFLAHNGGKRKGAVCTYLETWHLDIEEFLELRKNTGDDRRRTHDMNTSNWIPDLFMRRVFEGGQWTLFSPVNCPDLHDKFGSEFELAYQAYEEKADRGELKPFRRLPAKDLWRKMLTMLFETGHPWITFKDACNLRSPQQHVGVVHSSNLCTEITLNTSDSEIAVCNLGSVNLSQHLQNGQINHEKLRKTITVAMRMLDNVIDINFYPVKKARDSNLRHRPVGLGIMGFQDCLYQLRTPYASAQAVDFADKSMEAVCYYAYLASTELAAERGRYSTYRGSLWEQGILPHDSIDLLLKQRAAGHLDVDRSVSLDWDSLRVRIREHGMRNSNCVAIAPTATISNIIGVDASIEPCFGNLSVKSNLSGEFTVVNEYLVNDLKRLGLWDSVMLVDLKHFDGSLRQIDRVPEELKVLYATAFEVEPSWLIEAASRRQKWIDQAQSLNVYMAGASGKKLDDIYKLAWVRGLKTTYYLRTLSATHVEKSTGSAGALNAVSSNAAHQSPAQVHSTTSPATDVKFCAIDDPGCESCQ